MAYSYAWETLFNPGKAVDFFPVGSRQPFEVHKDKFSRANA
jgi:hypothetical protein